MAKRAARFRHPEFQASACAGKERYATPQMAHAVLKRRVSRGRTIVVYRCPCCGFFHHGSSLRG